MNKTWKNCHGFCSFHSYKMTKFTDYILGTAKYGPVENEHNKARVLPSWEALCHGRLRGVDAIWQFDAVATAVALTALTIAHHHTAQTELGRHGTAWELYIQGRRRARGGGGVAWRGLCSVCSVG